MKKSGSFQGPLRQEGWCWTGRGAGSKEGRDLRGTMERPFHVILDEAKAQTQSVLSIAL